MRADTDHISIVGNVYKLAFWTIAHLSQNPKLLEHIRQEILPAVKGQSIDEKFLLEDCPKLDSLVSETLRMTVTSSLARVMLATTVVGGKTLHKGRKIMVCTRSRSSISQ